MARGQRGEQSDRMLRAAESGNRAAQAAHDSRERSRQFDESVNQQELDRWQRQWEEKRSNELKKDELDRRYGPKDQGGRDGSIFGGRNVSNFNQNQNAPEDPNTALKREQLDLQRQELDERRRQFQESQQLRAAQAGLQPGGAGAGDPARDMQRVAQALQQNPNDPRLQRMMQEMARGREQGSLGLESDGRKWVPTPEAQAGAKQDRETARINAEAARMNAVVRMRELSVKASQLQAQIDGGSATPEQKAQFQKVLKDLMKPLNKSLNLQMAYSQNLGTDKQWSDLQALVDQAAAKGVAGKFLEVQQEVSARQYGPRLQTFLDERSATDFVKYVAYAGGKMPEGVTVNTGTAAYQTFIRNSGIAEKILKTGMNAALYPVTTSDRWARMVNQYGAFLTISGKQAAGEGGALPEISRTTESDGQMTGAWGQPQGMRGGHIQQTSPETKPGAHGPKPYKGEPSDPNISNLYEGLEGLGIQ